ncbi:MAG: transglutaminase family protein [Alphaproteobacteria bacterium]|nr:transglutaminase family protein [Alphaproteobacteria bacterium]
MMFEISHHLNYKYSDPVELNPFSINLRPRQDWNQKLHHFEYSVSPTPYATYQNIDIENNTSLIAFFNQPTNYLSVNIKSRVETILENSFNYLLLPQALKLPFTYPPEMKASLHRYLYNRHDSPALTEVTFTLLRESNYETLPFLCLVADFIYKNHQSYIRDEGGPLTPCSILQTKYGTCRDFALLFMEIVRKAGLASRFVSGYSKENPALKVEKYEMHSWAEVYLPGAGWRGFDPSLGLAITDWHIVLCTGADPHEAPSTSGSYIGTPSSSEFSYHIDFHVKQDHMSYSL